jgi:hypothetical protein
MGKVHVAMVDVSGGKVLYGYHNDRMGTPEILTTRIENAETVVREAWYEPFGEAHIHPSSSVVNNIRLPVQYFDAETGNHYNGARYYDPRIVKNPVLPHGAFKNQTSTAVGFSPHDDGTEYTA